MSEIGSIIDYTINTSFLSSRTFANPEVLAAAFQVYIKYLDLMTQQVTSIKEANDFIEKFLKYTEEKRKDPEYKDVEFGMNAKIGADYFRKIFMLVERETMRYLADQKNPPANVGEQSQYLKDTGHRMAVYGLDMVRKKQ